MNKEIKYYKRKNGDIEEIKYCDNKQLLQLIRYNLRIEVLATIDELNQYLLGNVTIEAASDATWELTHKFNELKKPLNQKPL